MPRFLCSLTLGKHFGCLIDDHKKAYPNTCDADDDAVCIYNTPYQTNDFEMMKKKKKTRVVKCL